MRVMYLRQSQDLTGQAVAVARQQTECQRWADANGWTIGATYTDNDRSASKGTRPEYQRLLTDIEAGTVTGVLAWDLDRLHRQPMELEHFIALADRHSIKLGTVTGEANLSTDNGRLYARIKGAVARAEVERKAARQQATNRQQMAAGDYQPRVRPFGWVKTIDGTRPLYNELVSEEADALRQAASDIIDGTRTMYSVYTEWNATGLLTAQGRDWTNNSFRKMLIRPRNAGIAEVDGQRVKATCAPIFSEETLDLLLGMTQSRQKQSHRATRTHPLSGVADCGRCGGPLYHAWTRTKYKGVATRYGVYSCRKGCLAISAKVFDHKVLGTLTFTLGASVRFAAVEFGVSGTIEDIRAARADLASLDDEASQIMSASIGVKERLALLEQVQTRRADHATKIESLIGSNRVATLIADLTQTGGVGIDNIREVRRRLTALPVADQTALVRHLFTIGVAPSGKKGRQTADAIRDRITMRDMTGEIV